MAKLENWLKKQEKWSSKTFGHGRRTLGLLEHIRRELVEIEERPNDLGEWIDVVILALDGFWRHGGNPDSVMEYLTAKHRENFLRRWPKPNSEHEAVEHIRG